jgi:hypothetical protein
MANAALTPVNDLIQVSVLIIPQQGNNDCSGYFGKGEDCKITHVPSTDSPIFATIMAKYDAEDSADNKVYQGSSENDWAFDNTNSHTVDNTTSGTWQYSGSNYPGISFWVAKGGNEGFILNWMVKQESVDNNYCSVGSEFTIACLSVSVAVTSGYWAAPNPHDLSHISFYGNKCDNNCEPTTQVPEPASIALFALALLGIATRRKISISK